MGRSKGDLKSQTLPSSPTRSFSSSSSSSDFEFTISLSPRNKLHCPADELFYKGQLLPLSLSPRLSMVQTLLLASSSTSSSSDSATTASRDSTASTDSTESSSRSSSVTEDDHEFKRLNQCLPIASQIAHIKKTKYFSLSRFSSVFKKNRDPENTSNNNNISVSSSSVSATGSSSMKRVGVSAKEVIRRYFKKVKPLYEKLSSQKHHQQQQQGSVSVSKGKKESNNNGVLFSHSFSGNLRYPRKRNCATSCPSSIRSSPSHSGVLNRLGVAVSGTNTSNTTSGSNVGCSESSSMEELQNAIQGAIAHCKNSMVQNKRLVSQEI
ncbi:hypothetical protein GIB67_029041 [Kingdonia uniflora]|uniref:Membrane-associated kinase regulator 1 n=1 Tax=Kingdonia uniflora TaxID=39325 RepID=A0A7J7N6U9_9MAGN|nr:hypothetical protein GIB67_029041 [Kingdonia uniflora]